MLVTFVGKFTEMSANRNGEKEIPYKYLFSFVWCHQVCGGESKDRNPDGQWVWG